MKKVKSNGIKSNDEEKMMMKVKSNNNVVVVVILLFYVHGKHLRSCRDGQLT